MNDDAFLSTVMAMPSDSGPKSVYADWLEERGESRAGWWRFAAKHNRYPNKWGNFLRWYPSSGEDPSPAYLPVMLYRHLDSFEKGDAERSWRCAETLWMKMTPAQQVFMVAANDFWEIEGYTRPKYKSIVLPRSPFEETTICRGDIIRLPIDDQSHSIAVGEPLYLTRHNKLSSSNFAQDRFGRALDSGDPGDFIRIMVE